MRTGRNNSSQHWARFCIIPVLVANALSSPGHTIRSLDQLARTNTAGCVVASHILHQFRRLLLEHGGMQHSTSSFTLSVPEWLTRLHDNCLQAIPTRYLPEPSSPIRPQHTDDDHQSHPCYMQTTVNAAVTLHSAALPDLLCTATTAIAPEQTIATLPLGHPWLRPHSSNESMFLQASASMPQSNLSALAPLPPCVNVIALRHISPDEVIFADPANKHTSSPLHTNRRAILMGATNERS